MATAQPPVQLPRFTRNQLIVAGAAVLIAAAAAAGATAALRPTPTPVAPGLSVLPAQPGGAQAAGQAGATTDGAFASTKAAAGSAPAMGAAAPSGVYPVPIGYCQQAPTVQLSGRVLGVSAMAPVDGGTDAGRALSVTVQNVAPSGSDAMAGLNTRLAAVEGALGGIGATQVTHNSVNVWGGPPYNGNQYTASAQVTAVIKVSQLGAVGDALSKLGGVTGYNAYAPAPAPTADQVGKAIAAATATAAAMAKASADAAGVSLGAVQQVSAQPPVSCGWGPSGPQQVVQVAMTYSLK